jgi:hypothetical protein
MPLFLDTTGNQVLGIGLCDRCHRKFPLLELMPDPNSPGLRVCKDDLDQFDPYRLPPPVPDKFDLPFTRPDVTFTAPVAPAQASAFPAAPEYLAAGPGDPFITGPGGEEILT